MPKQKKKPTTPDASSVSKPAKPPCSQRSSYTAQGERGNGQPGGNATEGDAPIHNHMDDASNTIQRVTMEFAKTLAPAMKPGTTYECLLDLMEHAVCDAFDVVYADLTTQAGRAMDTLAAKESWLSTNWQRAAPPEVLQDKPTFEDFKKEVQSLVEDFGPALADRSLAASNSADGHSPRRQVFESLMGLSGSPSSDINDMAARYRARGAAPAAASPKLGAHPTRHAGKDAPPKAKAKETRPRAQVPPQDEGVRSRISPHGEPELSAGVEMSSTDFLNQFRFVLIGSNNSHVHQVHQLILLHLKLFRLSALPVDATVKPSTDSRPTTATITATTVEESSLNTPFHLLLPFPDPVRPSPPNPEDVSEFVAITTLVATPEHLLNPTYGRKVFQKCNGVILVYSREDYDNQVNDEDLEDPDGPGRATLSRGSRSSLELLPYLYVEARHFTNNMHLPAVAVSFTPESKTATSENAADASAPPAKLDTASSTTSTKPSTESRRKPPPEPSRSGRRTKQNPYPTAQQFSDLMFEGSSDAGQVLDHDDLTLTLGPRLTPHTPQPAIHALLQSLVTDVLTARSPVSHKARTANPALAAAPRRPNLPYAKILIAQEERKIGVVVTRPAASGADHPPAAVSGAVAAPAPRGGGRLKGKQRAKVKAEALAQAQAQGSRPAATQTALDGAEGGGDGGHGVDELDGEAGGEPRGEHEQQLPAPMAPPGRRWPLPAVAESFVGVKGGVKK